MTEEKELLEKTLNEFYTLKEKYNNDIQKIKHGLTAKYGINNSSQKKRDEYLKHKPKCVNCKRNVGTIFSDKDRVLKAICGDKDEPCTLNIEIFMGKKEHIDDIIDAMEESISEIKEKIIKLKLDLIYNYKIEDEVIEEFTQLKRNYIEIQKNMNILTKKKQKIITNNGEKNILIENLNKQITTLIGYINDKIKTYKEGGDSQDITEIIELYNVDLKNKLDQIRLNKYNTNYVTKINDPELYPKKFDVYQLVQNNSTDELYISLMGEKKTRVIDFKK